MREAAAVESSQVRLGVAVVGLGLHAERNTIPALGEVPGVELVGLYSRSLKRCQELCSRFGLQAFRDPSEVLESENVQAVYLANLPSNRAEWIASCFKAGKHVWCEKPLLCPEDDLVSLMSQSRERNLVLAECFMFVHHPQFGKIRKLLADSVMGRCYSLKARFGFPHLSPGNFRYDPKRGGGALLDAGGYPIKALTALWGKPDRWHSRLLRTAEYQVDLGGEIWALYDDGRSAYLEWGFGRCYSNEMEIWGETGVLYVPRAFSKPPTLETEISLRRSDGTLELHPVPASNHFITMFSSLRQATGEPALAEQWRREAEQQFDWLRSISRST